jgi:predicted NBD/HSP70 family sugar kinase
MTTDDRRRRTPHEEKKLDLEHQRRGFSEYAHALRHGKWRRKRRSTHSSYRSRVAALLDQALAGVGRGTDPDEVDVGGVIRERIEKWGATPLSEWVRERLDRRVARYVRSFFTKHYEHGKHGEPFARVLAALVVERDGRTSRLGHRLERLLEVIDAPDTDPVEHVDPKLVRDARWLRAFFDDESGRRERLGECIHSHEA